MPPGISMLEIYLQLGFSHALVRGMGVIVGVLLVEEGLEDYDFVPGLDKAHECTEHTFIRAGCDSDFGIGVDVTAHER